MITSRHALLALVAATAATVGGCTTQDAVPPASRPVAATDSAGRTASTLATSPVSLPATSFSTAPPTTPPLVPPSSVDAADQPPTTTAAPTGTPSDTPTEFFVGGPGDGWLHLGRWTGTEWERATDDAESTGGTSIGEGVAVGVHTLGAAQIDATTGPPAQACPDGWEGPSITPNPGSPAVPGFGFGSIAFAAEWTANPRPTAAVTSAVETFTQAGRDAFAGTVVDPVDGVVEQIVVGDLDGDGDSESLVSFGGPGYATLLLIDVDSGASAMVERSISEGQPPVDFDSFRVLAVLDMNGDGVMEFVVHSWDGGRSASAPTSTVSATAYSYDGTQAVTMLKVSC